MKVKIKNLKLLNENMLITEGYIKQIIEEEIRLMIEEGFLQDLGSKANNILKALVFSAAMGGAVGGTAHAAPPGVLQHTETPITSTQHVNASDVAIDLAKKINDAKFKDRFGLDLRADPNDPKIENLAKTISELYTKHGHGDQTIELYTQKVFEIMEATLRGKSPAGHVYEYTNKILKRKLSDARSKLAMKKNKIPKTIRITKTEIRNNPVLIQQAALSIYFDADQGKPIKPALKILSSRIRRAIKDKDITVKQAKEIYNIIKNTKRPAESMKKINKLLGLSK